MDNNVSESSSSSTGFEDNNHAASANNNVSSSHEDSSDDDEGENNPEFSRRSVAWDYFSKSQLDQNKAHCKLCPINKPTTLSLPMGTTTSMFNHIRFRHPEKWSECEQKKRKSVDDLNLRRKKTRIEGRLLNSREIDELVMKFIAMDLQPFSTVSGEGFKNLMEGLRPDYELPHRTTFSRTIGPKQFEETKTRLKEQINKDVDGGLLSLSFTSDCWTSRASHSYISLTVHYMTRDFELRNITLGIQQLESSHTSAHLEAVLEDMLKEWGLVNLPNVVIYGVTDNAPNMPAAVRLGGWISLRCFAHTLQLVLENSRKYVKGMNELLQKARRIATHFHHSNEARRSLAEAQEVTDGSRALNIIQMVESRWNSEYLMLERMIQLKAPISVVLANSTRIDNLTGSEWKLVEQIVQIMEPLYDATVLSSSKKYPTLSMTIPIIQTLKDVLQRIDLAGLSISSPVAIFKKLLIEFLESRFSEIFIESLYHKATFLDPRFKTYFLEDDKMMIIKRELTEEIVTVKTSPNVQRDSSSSNAHEATSPPHRSTERPNLLAFLDGVRSSQRSPDNDTELRAEIDRELLAYTQSMRILQEDDPINWWKVQAPKYPHLSSMARRYLPIPTTSVESERLFSSAGDVVTNHRVSLTPKNVEMMVFLHKNLPQLANFDIL